MKKILHVIDSLSVGGAEKLLVSIINELTDFENHLLIIREPIILKDKIENLASFSNLNAHSFRQAVLKFPHVKKYIQKHKFDIVHSHLYESNIIARLATPRNIKLFNSIHAVSSQANYNDSKASLWLEKLSYKKRHHLIHVSKTVADDFDKWVGIKGPSSILYNFIEDIFFQQLPNPEFNKGSLKLIAVGNLRYQKNYPYLIEAFKKMPASVSLDIYGEGPLRQELQAQIDEHNLNITLQGLKSDVHKILSNYDVFVMCSHFEGQPVALLEAMACGLPALLSDIPVLREVGQQNAVYFDIKNPNDFVKKITEVLKGQHNLEILSKGGYAFAVKNAQKANYIRKLKSFYLS